jgi:hypothetical protein
MEDLVDPAERALALIAKGEAPIKPEYCLYKDPPAGEKRKRPASTAGSEAAGNTVQTKKPTPSEMRKEYRKIMHAPELGSKKDGASGGGEEAREVSEEKNHLSSELMKSLRKHQINFPSTTAAIAKLGIEVRSQKTSSKWDPKSFEGKHRQEKWSKMVKEAAEEEGLDESVKALLIQLAARDNVPKKKGRFDNFCRCVEKVKDAAVVDKVWELLQKRRVDTRDADLARMNKAQAQLLCWPFQQGACTFGDQCRFSHDLSKAQSTGTATDGAGGNGGDGDVVHNYFANQQVKKQVKNFPQIGLSNSVTSPHTRPRFRNDIPFASVRIVTGAQVPRADLSDHLLTNVRFHLSVACWLKRSWKRACRFEQHHGEIIFPCG